MLDAKKHIVVKLESISNDFHNSHGLPSYTSLLCALWTYLFFQHKDQHEEMKQN